MITDADLDNWFTYHPPQTSDAVERYQRIRNMGWDLARLIRDETPASADQTTAIRAVRQAVMWANAAIACDNTPAGDGDAVMDGPGAPGGG